MEKTKKRRKILVTGSSGMLGNALCKELSGDYDIVGLDISHSKANFKLGAFIKCDITNREKIAESITGAKPDLVIHAAAWTDVDGCEIYTKKAFRINRGGTENVAFACKKEDIPIMFISTDFIFDGKKRAPYRESDLPKPLSVYGKTKLEGEKVIKKHAKKFFIVRTSWLFGRFGKNFVKAILEISKRRKKLEVVDDQVGSPTYAKDLARAIKALIKKGKYGIYHVSNKGAVNWYEYAKVILQKAEMRNEVIPITSRMLNRPAPRPLYSLLDCRRFERVTGLKMRNWKKALYEYLDEIS